MRNRTPFFQRLKQIFIGDARNIHDPTIFITGSIVAFAVVVKRHYQRTGTMLGRLNGLVELARTEMNAAAEGKKKRKKGAVCDPTARTAVLFVNGFSGTGLHTLFSIIRLFEGIYKNFVFVQIGLVDSFFSRWLHNYSAFAIQRRFYNMGIPIVILPIRV